MRVEWVVAALVLVHVLYALGPPLSLTDLFNYLHYGRLGALYGHNPYADLPLLAPGDPAYRFSNWHHLPSPYGPFFTLIAYALAPLPLHAAYWTWKAIAALASLGCLALVWWLARRLGRSPQRALVFAGLNPLVLVYGLGGQHNDALMLFCALAAVALVVRGARDRRPGLGRRGRRGDRRGRRVQALAAGPRAAGDPRRAPARGRGGGRGRDGRRGGRRGARRLRRPPAGHRAAGQPRRRP